jgi:hypothetical protein
MLKKPRLWTENVSFHFFRGAAVSVINTHFNYHTSCNHQVGSFFGFQFFGSLLTIVFYNVAFCTTSEMLHLVSFVLMLVTSLGICTIGMRPGGEVERGWLILLTLYNPGCPTRISIPSQPFELQVPTFSAIAICWSGLQS